MSDDASIDVSIPAGATRAEEERLVQAAIDENVEKYIDDLLGGLGGAFK